MRQLTTWVEDNFYDRIKHASALEMRSVSAFIRMAARDRVVAVETQFGVRNG